MLLSLILSILLPFAQTDVQGVDPHRYGGHAYMYCFEDYPAVAAPEGYEVFHISHFGRHGARYCTDSAYYDTVMDCLRAGHDSLGLTAYGQELYDRYLAVYPFLKGHDGDLSDPGRWQQRMLADRMVDNYPGLFDGTPQIEASSTIVHRVITSMATFCCELQKRVPAAEIEMRADYTEMSFCNPISDKNPYFDMATGFAASFEGGMDLYERTVAFQQGKMHPEAFLSKIFPDGGRLISALGDGYKIESAFFQTAIHMQCLDLDEDFLDMFEEDELRGCFEGENLWQYVFRGSGLYCHNVYPSLSASLLEDLIMDGEKAAGGSAPAVRLRFGHDSAVSSLLALMHVNGFDTEESDFDKVMDVWQLWQVPMASNLQLIFYRNGASDVLVRILYNEKDASTPLPTDMYPFYRWEDFKNYYTTVSEQAKQTLSTYSR